PSMRGMGSTPPGLRATWAGRRARTSRAACAKRSSGILKPGHGGGVYVQAPIAANVSASQRALTDMRSARLLITGSQGQVGRELVARGETAGFEVIALARNDLDISDASAVAHAIADTTPDIVINAATYTAVER